MTAGRLIRHPATLLAGLLLVVYLPVLVSQTFFVRDLLLQYVPAKTFLSESLRSGDFPLWNPLLHGGQPFVANPQNLATSPLWILSSFLPVLAGLNLVIVVHLAVGLLGTYWLARVLGLGREASSVAAIAFTFAGVIVSLVNLTHMLLTIVWMPIMIGAAMRARTGDTTRWVAIAGLAGGMLILAGGAEMILLSFLTLGVFGLAGLWSEDRARVSAIVIGVVSIAALVGSIRIWTTADYLPETARGESQSYAEMVGYSVHPRQLPELVVAGFAGDLDGIAATKYWGRALEGAVPYLFSLHFGAGVLILAIIGGTSRGSPLPVPLRCALGAIAVLGVVISLGKHLPGFEMTAGWPVVSKFRYPVKVMVIAAMPVAILAGAGLEAIVRQTLGARRALALVLAGVSAVFGTAALSTRWDAGAGFWSNWFGSPMTVADLQGLGAALAIPAAVTLLIGIAVSAPRLNAVVLAALVCAEIVWAGARVNATAPRSIFDPPLVVEKLRDLVGGDRFLRVRGPEVSRVSSRENSSRFFARWTIDTFEFHTAYLWGLPQVLHSDFDGLAPRRIVTIRDMVATADRDLTARALAMSGIRVVMANELVTDSRFQLAGTYRPETGDPLFLYTYDHGRTARFVSEVVAAKDEADAVRVLRDDAFDPDRQVVIESGGPARSPCDSLQASTSFSRTGPDETITHVVTNCAGYLVIAEPFLPGWRTEVDGVGVEAIRANLAFTAVPLEAGTHVVSRRFRPRGLAASLAVTLLSTLVALFLALRRGSRIPVAE